MTMRILLKIVVFPVALTLGIISGFLRFLTFVGGGLISILAYLMAAFITVILLFGFIPLVRHLVDILSALYSVRMDYLQ